MKLIIISMLLFSSPAFAQSEPKCDPIGRTSKGDLVYSMECRNIPGLAAGVNGYNPLPKEITLPNDLKTSAKPRAPESK